MTHTGEDGQMGGERERAQEAEPRGPGSGGAQMSEQINTARFAPSLGAGEARVRPVYLYLLLLIISATPAGSYEALLSDTRRHI